MNTVMNFVGAAIPVLCVVACIAICFSKSGKEIINNKKSDKPWDNLTWIAGLFISGMGVALVTNVPGDIAGFLDPNGFNWEPLPAIVLECMYNGIPVWCLYSLVALWYTKHMDSKFGKIMAMCSTVLGMAVSLWTGSNAIVKMLGLNSVWGIRFVIASAMVIIAILSAKNNWLKKVSRIASFLLVICAMFLVAMDKSNINPVPITGSLDKAFWKEWFFGSLSSSWWWWYLSWSMTVGRWMAHISNGKSVRKFIIGSSLIPSIFIGVWVLICYWYSNVIGSLSIVGNPHTIILAILFAITGMLFMSGTLDSDCKVFTEDFEYITNGAIKQKTVIPYYGIFVLFFFCLYTSGLVDGWTTNMYCSLIFVPIIIWVFATGIKMILGKEKPYDALSDNTNK